MARIRKQQPAQTGDHATQKSFRLYHDQDENLIDWLAEYAARYKQTDLIRLALYMLSGLDMPAELAELLPPQPAPRQLPLPEADRASDQIELLFEELDYQRREANEQIAALYQELADEKHHASRQLENMIAELVELRQAIHQPAPVAAVAPQDQTAAAPQPPPTLPESPGTVQSSGIDMSRSRPRPQARKMPAAAPAPPPEELSEQDAIRLAKIMANSIKRASRGGGEPVG
jgi:DNA-binding transcriptional MerR regulator